MSENFSPVEEQNSSSDDLNEAEKKLIEAARQGQRAQLAGARIRASIIRDLVLELRKDWVLQPMGVHIDDAVIEGELALEGCQLQKPLLFFKCRFGEADNLAPVLQLRDSRMKRIGFANCVINGRFNADRIYIESSAFIQNTVVRSRLRLRGSEIHGSLSLEQSTFVEPETAIVLDHARIDGPLLIRGAEIRGELRLPGARISGGVLAEESKLSNDTTAIVADGIQVDGPVVFNNAEIKGRLQFRGSEIKALLMNRSRISGQEPAIIAESLKVDGDFSFSNALIRGGITLNNAQILGQLQAAHAEIRGSGFSVSGAGVYVRQGWNMTGASLHGALRIDGAHIGKTFVANKLKIATDAQAISANVIHVAGDWIMRGADLSGSIRIPGADIEGQLALTDSTIKSGILAIRADGCRIRGGWYMGRARITGRIRFPAAIIDNQVRFKGSEFNVVQGPAIVLSGSRIKRDLILSDGFKATGGIVLDQTEVDGVVDFQGSNIECAYHYRSGTTVSLRDQDELVAIFDRTAVSFVDARLGRLQMPEKPEFRPVGIIDFSRAQVGTFEDYADAWPPPVDRKRPKETGRSLDELGLDIDHLILDGFSYEHLENPSGLLPGDPRSRSMSTAKSRLNWLFGQSEIDLYDHFKPQAWVQLSKRLDAQGFHEDARQLSIERRRWHRRSQSVKKLTQLQSYLLDLFALFGFNPWRTIGWMCVFVILFSGIWYTAAMNCTRSGCTDETVYVRSEYGRFSGDPATFQRTYPQFHALAYSFDLFIPIINFGYQDYWRPNIRYGPITSWKLPDSVSELARYVTDRGSGEPSGTNSFIVHITWGGILYVLSIVEMILGLVLSSLAITGFTGLLRQDD